MRSFFSSFCISRLRGRDCLFLFLSLSSGKEVKGSFMGEDSIEAVGVDPSSCSS